MATFLYLIHPIRQAMLTEGSTPEEERLVEAHFAYLQTLYQQDIASLVGRSLTTGPESIGLMVFSATDQSEAEAIAAHDPAVQGSVFRVEVLPFRVLFPPPPEN